MFGENPEFSTLKEVFGNSKSRKIDGISKKNWRCLKLPKLSKIKILDEPLHKPLVVSHKKKVHV